MITIKNMSKTLVITLSTLPKISGAPAGLADKMMADSKAMLCIKTDGPFHTFSFKSSIMPMDMSFKVGEEFEYKNPMDPTDVQKVNIFLTHSIIDCDLKKSLFEFRVIGKSYLIL